MQKIFLFVLAVVMLLPNFFHKDILPIFSFDKKEKFNSQLNYINSVSKLEAHTDSLAIKKNIRSDSYEYAALLESVVEERFYHGFSHFALNENWIAAVCGKIFNEGHGCKVKAEDILQHSYAACSQQSIVMMAVLRDKKINYRNIGFPHHYALEIEDKQQWYFVDADMEPVMTKEQRLQQNWNHQNDQLKKYYDTNRFNDLDYKFGKGVLATNGPLNEIPAANARLFHAVTSILSKTLWIIPLFLLFFIPQFSFSSRFAFRLKRRSVPSVSLAV